jgi:hypothetical protein
MELDAPCILPACCLTQPPMMTDKPGAALCLMTHYILTTGSLCDKSSDGLIMQRR